MSASSLLSYAGWTFLPNLVTGWLQSFYYSITIRAGDPKPQPNSLRYTKHRRRIHCAVIIIYLLYTIFEADHYLRHDGDFYSDLGVGFEAEEKAVKSKFRRLAAIYHPDKISDPSQATIAETYFVRLKNAQDTLIHPAKKYAYDRFGPDILAWQNCSSIRDYLLLGLQSSCMPVYLGGGLVMGLLAFTGYLQWGRYWRYLCFALLLLLETHTLTRPKTPILSFVNPLLTSLTTHPPLLPFQLIVLARKAAFSFFIALTQLGPVFQDPNAVKQPNNRNAVEDQQLSRLEHMVGGLDGEASRLLQLEMTPLVGDEQGLGELRGKVKEWLVTNTIRADPEVRDAMGRALVRRRGGSGAMARGRGGRTG